jgi:hypothetical protein
MISSFHGILSFLALLHISPPSAFFAALSKMARESSEIVFEPLADASDDEDETESVVVEMNSSADALSERARKDAAPTNDAMNCLLPNS